MARPGGLESMYAPMHGLMDRGVCSSKQRPCTVAVPPVRAVAHSSRACMHGGPIRVRERRRVPCLRTYLRQTIILECCHVLTLTIVTLRRTRAHSTHARRHSSMQHVNAAARPCVYVPSPALLSATHADMLACAWDGNAVPSSGLTSCTTTTPRY